MVIKYGLDCAVSTLAFHRTWSFSNYFIPGMVWNGPVLASGESLGAYYVSMLMLALPFALLGSLITLKRLEVLKLPPWLVTLFYIPFINMIFFVILSVVESAPSKSVELSLGPSPADENIAKKIIGPKDEQAQSVPLLVDAEAPQTLKEEDAIERRPALISATAFTRTDGRFVALMDKLPQDGVKAYFAAAALPVPIAVLAALFSVSVLGTYGWSVFTAIPFIASIAAPILLGWRSRRSLPECLLVGVLSLMIMASALLLIPFEGIICLLMASPLAVGVGIVGGAVGYAIQANLPRSESMPKLMSCFAIILPLLIIGEYITPADVPLYENVSTIKIDAPPQTVWKYLINFPPMGAPEDWVFKTGIAYPIRAKITGHGPGAVRHCIFTTGEFIEPIKVWDEPHLLRFGVLAQAPPMHELSPYPDLHPPHLDNYLVAKQGQFKLSETSPNHTELSGTTWYQNYMGPSPYWRLWSDWIIHRIHMRVLNHVKRLAENEMQGSVHF